MIDCLINELLQLPLERKIGQLLYIGLPGTELDTQTRDILEAIQPGGVIIFGRNVASPLQLRGLLDGVREMVASQPLLGIDQEGGLVDRLRRITTPMPAVRTIREHGDLAAARALGRISGEMLGLLGFNMNFAPVMSIMNEARDLLQNGLYSRSFGRSPGEVLGYTTVYLRGLQGAGCLGCVKHFPGIGTGEIDSHIEVPVIKLTHDDLIAQDLAPYIELFQREDEIVKAVMVSHGAFPDFQPKDEMVHGKLIPASLNYQIVTKLLREELTFTGLVVTDDLEMGAVAKLYEIEDAAVAALLAGEDMLLICARPDLIHRAFAGLLAAVKSGRIPLERIDDALTHIAVYKSAVHPTVAFDEAKFQALTQEIAVLNAKLNYVYGGKI